MYGYFLTEVLPFDQCPRQELGGCKWLKEAAARGCETVFCARGRHVRTPCRAILARFDVQTEAIERYRVSYGCHSATPQRQINNDLGE